MHARLTLVISLLCSAFLAGCVEEPQTISLASVDAEPDPEPLDAEPVDDGDGSVGEDDEPADGDANETDTDGLDRPPLPNATLTADVLSGDAPLVVRFTIEAENATTWSLHLGEGEPVEGDSFPADVEHTYGSAGNYTVNLTVAGEGGETVQSVEVVVGEAASLYPYTASGDVSTFCAYCDTFPPACVSWASGQAGVDCVVFVMPEGAAGHTYTVSSTAGDPDIYFVSDCDATAGGPVEYSGAAGSETGTVPSGAPCLIAWEFEEPTGSTITLVIE